MKLSRVNLILCHVVNTVWRGNHSSRVTIECEKFQYSICYFVTIWSQFFFKTELISFPYQI